MSVSNEGSPPQRTWSIHDDGDGQGSYFYNEMLGGYSTWTRHLDLPPDVIPEEATDTQLWLALCERQIREVFQLCNVCSSSRVFKKDPMFICGTCLKHCHYQCSRGCTMVVDSQLWDTYGPYLRSCKVCLEEESPKEGFVEGGPSPDQLTASAAANRLKSVCLPHKSRQHLQSVEDMIDARTITEKAAMTRIRQIVADHYCPNGSHKYFELLENREKCGNGIYASRDIPALTRIGIYPGYPDPNSAEQCARGRLSPKYALAEFNAADYYNVPFVELMDTVTPFLNEPGEHEGSNTAWLQENSSKVENGRLSVLTVRDIKKGEELTLSYGPLYPRDYPYAYDGMFTITQYGVFFSLSNNEKNSPPNSLLFSPWRIR